MKVTQQSTTRPRLEYLKPPHVKVLWRLWLWKEDLKIGLVCIPTAVVVLCSTCEAHYAARVHIRLSSFYVLRKEFHGWKNIESFNESHSDRSTILIYKFYP